MTVEAPVRTAVTMITILLCDSVDTPGVAVPSSTGTGADIVLGATTEKRDQTGSNPEMMSGEAKILK